MIPENKRPRPRSCLHLLSSPVLRQATALPADGIFEYYEGLVIPRSASVTLPSVEMVAMACLRAIQFSPMTDIRQLTACAKRWAAERPRCLSLTVREADLPAEQHPPTRAELNAQAVLQAPFGIAALSQAASQALPNLHRPSQPNAGAEAITRNLEQTPRYNGVAPVALERRSRSDSALPDHSVPE